MTSRGFTIFARGTLIGLALWLGVGTGNAQSPLKVASKSFTESVILGEIIAQTLTRSGLTARHQPQMGGTRILWSALRRGDIDIYPDYTGTIRQEILSGQPVGKGIEGIRAALKPLGIGVTRSLGFNNSYAIGMKAARARELKIETLSDLFRHPDIKLGFSNEFMDRADGWPALQARYRLPQQSVSGLDHDLAYRALDSGAVDAIDVYTTDAEISYYGLTLLQDDLGHFPDYDAVILYRLAAAESSPSLQGTLAALEGTIEADRMSRMNRAVKIDKKTEIAVASTALNKGGNASAAAIAPGLVERVSIRTGEHLILVGISLIAAIIIAIPLGIFAARNRRAGQGLLAIVGILQTIPGLAMLVFMIPLLGIGNAPAIGALFLYSLLPIVRNTHAGLTGISPALTESAIAMGLPGGVRLRRIELPLAMPAILAGIKTSAVINIGTATLGALIGAGGYGQPILTGIRLDDLGLIMEGAIPAAIMALLAQVIFDQIENRFYK